MLKKILLITLSTIAFTTHACSSLREMLAICIVNHLNSLTRDNNTKKTIRAIKKTKSIDNRQNGGLSALVPNLKKA